MEVELVYSYQDCNDDSNVWPNTSGIGLSTASVVSNDFMIDRPNNNEDDNSSELTTINDVSDQTSQVINRPTEAAPVEEQTRSNLSRPIENNSNSMPEEHTDIDLTQENNRSPNMVSGRPTNTVVRKRKRYGLSSSERKKNKIEELKFKHQIQPPSNDCKRKCTDKIDNHRREVINKMYWNLKTSEERRSFIFNTCERQDVKRRCTTELNQPRRRNKTIKYFLKDVDDKKHEVCKIFFLTTLGFNKKNDKFLHTIFSCEKGSINPKISMRGRKAAINKGPHDEIIAHIESFEPTIAHYRREHSPHTRYLPSDTNISLMHLDFITKHPQYKNCVSYELYRRILRERKISFTRLGHEECESCETFNLHEHSKEDLKEDCQICSS